MAKPAPLAVTLERVLAVPVTAIALGDGTRVAVLADPPYVGDARGLRPLALPAGLRPKAGEVDHAGIYFGRDNEPRIMGQRRTNAGEAAIYWRHLPNGWRDGREEIGQLAGAAPGGLWGVLGGSDPELVCCTGVVCIIKRQSGWTTVPAGNSQRIVTLQYGVLWAVDANGISSIDKHGWAVAIPPPAWREPQALWAVPGEAWVSAQQQLFHYLDGTWQATPSPVGEVSAFWGARRDSIWIAGSAGAAHFDGRGFRTLVLAGPLHAVCGRSDSEVWFGGDAGLFRIRAPN
ncbi:MAG: hypothetical protein ABUL62_09035 [Myxococcales bacterium]